MFNLEQSIVEWRQQMLADGIETPVPLEELEIHLREEIEQLMKSGLNEPAAFNSAMQKIGHAGSLKQEFTKTDTFLKTTGVPAIIFALLLIGYVAFLAGTVSWLPQRMASHFDLNGKANGWMDRSSAVILQGTFGLLLPLVIVAAFCAIKFAPTRGINFPRRDFWFAPERRDQTCTYLSRQGLWLANLMVGLQGVMWYQLIESNRADIPHLSLPGFMIALGIFGAGMIVWVLNLFRHFGKTA